jgi:hypothetical protein
MNFAFVISNNLLSSVDQQFKAENLEREFRKAVSKEEWRASKKLLKQLAKDSAKAYLVGIEEGLAGRERPTLDGLEELTRDSADPDTMRRIYQTIHSTCVAGYEIGSARRQLGR